MRVNCGEVQIFVTLNAIKDDPNFIISIAVKLKIVRRFFLQIKQEILKYFFIIVSIPPNIAAYCW